VPLAGGIFLPPSTDLIEQHVELPPKSEFNHGITDRRSLAAARLRGDSMIYRNIFDGDIVFFQRSGFDSISSGRILVVEKAGDEEGFAAWGLKRLVIEKSQSSRVSEFGDVADWEGPDLVLYS